VKPLGPIRRLIVHHSASPLSTTIEDIRRWHVDENGWEDVGYHHVISSLGLVYKGRDMAYQGAHARGSNADSIGVCLVGNNMESQNRWTREQVGALQKMWHSFRLLWDGIEVYGHRDVSTGTECPGLDVRALLLGPSVKELRR